MSPGVPLVLRAKCGRLRVGECFLHGRSYVAIAMYNGYNSTATTKPWLCRGPAMGGHHASFLDNGGRAGGYSCCFDTQHGGGGRCRRLPRALVALTVTTIIVVSLPPGELADEAFRDLLKKHNRPTESRASAECRGQRRSSRTGAQAKTGEAAKGARLASPAASSEVGQACRARFTLRVRWSVANG
jgi:hypothetical protein